MKNFTVSLLVMMCFNSSYAEEKSVDFFMKDNNLIKSIGGYFGGQGAVRFNENFGKKGEAVKYYFQDGKKVKKSNLDKEKVYCELTVKDVLKKNDLLSNPKTFTTIKRQFKIDVTSNPERPMISQHVHSDIQLFTSPNALIDNHGESMDKWQDSMPSPQNNPGSYIAGETEEGFAPQGAEFSCKNFKVCASMGELRKAVGANIDFLPNNNHPVTSPEYLVKEVEEAMSQCETQESLQTSINEAELLAAGSDLRKFGDELAKKISTNSMTKEAAEDALNSMGESLLKTLRSASSVKE